MRAEALSVPIHKPGQLARSRVNRAYIALALGLLWASLVAITTVAIVGAPPQLSWDEVVMVGLVWGIATSTAILYVFHRDDMRWVQNWRKGARGEELVGRCLAEMEPDGYRSLHDIDARFGNIDHVIAGPTGVFAIETKAWRGRVWLAKGPHLKVGTRNEDRALEQAKRGAMAVHDRIKDVGLEGWVEAVVVLTATPLPKGPMKVGAVYVITASQLPEFIRSRRRAMSALDAARAIAAVYRESQVVTSSRA